MNSVSDVDFLKYIVEGIVEYPEDIKIDRTTDSLGVLLNLSVNQKDIGRVIGKMGNTAQSIRCLLKSVGAKNNERVNMKIYDPARKSDADLPF